MSFSKIPNFFLPGDADIVLTPVVGIPQRAAELSASENPISWQFDTFIVGTDIAAEIQILVGGATINGDVFRIVATNETFPTIELVGSDSPGSGEFAISTSATVSALNIATVLNEDIIFCRLFYADAATLPGTIIITAINPGIKYNMQLEGAAVFSISANTIGQDCCFGQSLPEFSIFVDVFANGAQNYGEVVDKNTMEFVGRIQKNYQPDNLHNFDVAGLLRNFVKMPPPNDATLFKYPDALTNYALLYGFNTLNDLGGPVRTVTGVTAVNWINVAALDLLEANDLAAYTIEVGAANKQPLSNLPECKDFWQGQKDYINFIYKQVPGVINTVRVYMVPTFYDGTTGAEVQVSGGSAEGGQFSAPLENLPIGLIELSNGKKIKDFTLEIRASDTIPFNSLTIASQKYTIRRDCPERTTDLVFLNKLGGFDGVRLTERDNQSFNREVSEFEKTPPFFPTGSETIRGVQAANVECLERWATGWVPESHYEWLKELAGSPQVYQNTPDGLRAVVVTSVSISFDDEADKYNLFVEFAPTTLENSVKQ